jgi:signal transduction histidine kinase
MLEGNSTYSEATAWRPLRAPETGFPHLTDLLVAITSFALALSVWTLTSDKEGSLLASFIDVGMYLCGFIASFALLWRRSHPLQVHAIVLVIAVLLNSTSLSNSLFALSFSLYSLGRYASDDRASVLGMLAGLIFISINMFILDTPSIAGTITTGMVAALWYIGRRLRFRGEYLRLLEERTVHLERQRESESQRAVLAERARIAREMHDIVAHQLSLMTVQAGAAKTVSRTDPDAAHEAMEAVEKSGRQAVSEMRQLLDVLRPTDMQASSLGPQPGIRDIDKLIQDVTDAGVIVDLEINGATTGLAVLLELTVYRVVQEALTNVIKHAGKEAKAHVTIHISKDNVTVQIRDNGNAVNMSKSKGYGIVGMRERVELLGGSLTAAEHTAGGFEVRASLPTEAKAR